MTQDEFYSILMQDVEYIFKTGFKLSPEMFMQTMSYASEQYQLLLKRIEELEEPKTCEGCCWYVSELCTHWSSRQEDCCSRMVQLTDFYNDKDV